jgi:hypothetical protein
MTQPLKVDGVSIDDGLRGLRFDGFGDLHGTSSLVGSNYETPGRDGEVWRRKARAAGEISVKFAIVSTDRGPAARAAVNAEWLKILRMFPRRRTVMLTRALDVLGEYGIETIEHEAEAELVESIEPQWISKYAQVGVLTLRILGGVWHTTGDRRVFNITPSPAEFVPVGGTTDTHNIVLTFSGYSNTGIQRLTNLTTGVYVEIDYSKTSATTAPTLVLLVEDFRAYRPLAGVNYQQLRAVTHSGDPRFMILDPDEGPNEFALTGGKCRIEWRDAWL